MDETLEEEISFLEKSCERLRLEIEKQSTPVAANKPMRDSGIATMARAHGSQECLHDNAADNTVVGLNNKRMETPKIESSHKSGITVRKTARRNSSQNAQIPTESAQNEASARQIIDQTPISRSYAHQQSARALAQNDTPLYAHASLPARMQHYSPAMQAQPPFETYTRSEGAELLSDLQRHQDGTAPRNTIRQENATKCNIKPATFDGSHSWIDYKSHFDACAAINNWSVREKGLYLAVSLRGAAQGVLGNNLVRDWSAIQSVD